MINTKSATLKDATSTKKAYLFFTLGKALHFGDYHNEANTTRLSPCGCLIKKIPKTKGLNPTL